MDGMVYEKIGEVNGSWKAEIIESFLSAVGIDVQLIQDSITHSSYKGAFDLVQIFIPKVAVPRARILLQSFEEFQPEKDEDEEG